MTKKWTFGMQSETGGYVELITADTPTTSGGTSYLITSASGSLNGKTIVGLVATSTTLYDRTVQNLVKNNDPYSIGLVDSTGAKYFLTNVGGVYIFAPSSDTGTWQQYGTHSYQVYTETAPTPTPAVSGPTEGADTIAGTSGNDTINALGGDDKITWTTGADTIDGGNGTDTLTLAGEIANYDITYSTSSLAFSIKNGSDISTYKNIEKITASNVTYTIVKGVGSSALTLTGSSGSDYLFGGSGADTLTGGAGADRMVGGDGNDTYYVDNTGDQIIEKSEGGSDSVDSSVSYTLSANIEDLSLVGTGNINGTGNDLDNHISGNNGNNILEGKGGFNFLDGSSGNDTYLIGIGGNDIYDSSGIDIVKFTLLAKPQEFQFHLDGASLFVWYEGAAGYADALFGTNIENIAFTLGSNSISTYAFKADSKTTGSSLVGSNSKDILITGDANDSLNGLSGGDVMVGGLGNDTYAVDNIDDVVIENLSAGIDTVTSIIANYTLASNIENMTLTGRGLNGTGNNLANILLGNINKNTLSGGDGDDTLIGATGQDTLTGGAGRDIFKFTQVLDSAVKTPDTITDFVSDTDKVDLSGIDANTSIANDQAFTFIGSAAFSKVAGQLRFADSILTGDTNGDGAADFQIKMTGVTKLLTFDIVL